MSTRCDQNKAPGPGGFCAAGEDGGGEDIISRNAGHRKGNLERGRYSGSLSRPRPNAPGIFAYVGGIFSCL